MKTFSPLRKAACAVALSVSAAAMPALAQDSGFYLGASVGQSKYDATNETSGIFQTTTGTRTDDTDTGFSLAFGYRINPYIGVEFSFADFGDYTLSEYGGTTVTKPGVITPNTRPAYGLVNAQAGSKGYTLAAIGSLPMGNFEVFGKVGGIYAQTTLDLQLFSTSIDTAAVTPPLAPTACLSGCTWAFPGAGWGSVSAETTELLYAVGAGYTFAEVLFVKLEWTRVPNLGDEDKTLEADVDHISLGFQYRFN
jgi:hypothetical protein